MQHLFILVAKGAPAVWMDVVGSDKELLNIRLHQCVRSAVEHCFPFNKVSPIDESLTLGWPQSKEGCG